MGRKINPFKTTKTKTSFAMADTVCTAAIWQEIGRLQIQAGEGLSVGYDNFGGMANASGRILFNPETAAGVAIPSMLRIDVETPKKRVERTLFEGRSERLLLGAADPSIQEPLPFIDVTIGEDWYLVLRLLVDTTATMAVATTDLSMDCTSWDVV
jgi:hypothetical protein